MPVILFDDVFEYIGDFEMYQFLLYLLLGITSFYPAYEVIAITFLGATPDHWCKVDRLENFTHSYQKTIAIPYTADGDYDTCTYYDIDYNNFSDQDLLLWDRSQWNTSKVTECSERVYDQSQYISTAVTQWDMACGQEWLVSLSSTMYLLGIMVGAPLSGVISDKVGRFPTLTFSCAIHLVLMIIAPLSPNFVVLMTLRFLIAASNVVAFLSAFVIIMELIGPRWRTAAGCIFQLFWSLGFMVIPAIAYFCRDFIALQWILVGPGLVCIPFFFLIPESPRWLIAKGKNKKAIKILDHIAVVNNRVLPEGLELKAPDDAGEKGSFGDLFRYPVLRREILIAYLAWFTNSLIYYGLSLNTGTLVGSVYLNTFLSGAVEIPAILLCILFMAKIGRRITLGGGFLVGGIACLAMIPLLNNPSLGWLMTTFAMLGKAAITVTFTCVYVYTAELFPTPVRHLAMGSSSMMARISGLATPYMGKPMMALWQPLPSVIFGVFAIMSGLLSFLLPETLNTKMPDTLQEAEAIGRLGKKKTKKTSEMGHQNSGFSNDIQNGKCINEDKVNNSEESRL